VESVEFSTAVSAVTVSGDGRYLAAGDKQGEIVIYARDQVIRETSRIQMKGAIQALAISEDNRLIAASDSAGNYQVHSLYLRDVICESARVVAATAAAYITDGTALVIGCTDGTCRLLADREATPLKTLPDNFSFAGPAARAFGCGIWAAVGPQGNWKAWDLKAETGLGSMGAGGLSDTIAVYPDGSLVITGYRSGWAVAWDTDSGAERGRHTLHSGGIVALEFLPDGSQLVSAGSDRVVRAWSLETARATKEDCITFVIDRRHRESQGQLRAVRFHSHWERHLEDRVLSLATDPRGELVAVGTAAGIVFLHAADGRPAGENLSTACSWSCVAFSPDGSLLLGVSKEGACYLWDVRERYQRARFDLPCGTLGCAWRADGRTLAIVTCEGTIMMFSLEGCPPGTPIAPLLGYLTKGPCLVCCPQRDCGTNIPVRPSQTGYTIPCPRCNAPLRVGKPILELARFEEDE
jgi:WD40 repeat protein